MADPIMTIVFGVVDEFGYGVDSSCTVEAPFSIEAISSLSEMINIYKQQIEDEKGVETKIKSIYIEMNGAEFKE